MQENKLSSISKAASDDKIGDFWDTHDFTEFDTDAPDAQFLISEHPRMIMNPESFMKNKYQVVPQTATKKPAKAEVSDAEFRRRLKNISDWRTKRLAQLRPKDSR